MGSILRTTPMSKITLIAFILPMQLLFTNFSDFSIQSPLSQHFSRVHELETLYSLFVAPTQALARCFLVRKQTDSLSHFHWLSLSRKLFTGSLTRKKNLTQRTEMRATHKGFFTYRTTLGNTMRESRKFLYSPPTLTGRKTEADCFQARSLGCLL